MIGLWENGERVLNNRAVPPSAVVPVLPYPDVRAAVEFLTAAFGFVERTRIGESHRAQLAVGENDAVIVAEGGAAPPTIAHTRPVVVRIRVEDVDMAFARACDHGATVVEGLVDREYGERDCTVQDLAGYRWQLAQTTADVAPESFGCQTITPWPAYQIAEP
jgi:uncharacterized glyoxalase superfamily protein PhnB